MTHSRTKNELQRVYKVKKIYKKPYWDWVYKIIKNNKTDKSYLHLTIIFKSVVFDIRTVLGKKLRLKRSFFPGPAEGWHRS